ncbi:MAG: alpha/beta hydrolase, partial [Lachnospiraceae bacterium]|nr:alpha/beta hydrolase [Lachnospiraceae bacterium]
MARRCDTAHGLTGVSEDGYVIAWFMWQLQGDEAAAKAFVGEDAELLSNDLYQDVQIDID